MKLDQYKGWISDAFHWGLSIAFITLSVSTRNNKSTESNSWLEYSSWIFLCSFARFYYY